MKPFFYGALGGILVIIAFIAGVQFQSKSEQNGAIAISVLALVVSAGAFIVQYGTQVERRHGEIAQLRAQIMTALNALQSRLATHSMIIEMIKSELSRYPGFDPKFDPTGKPADLIKAISNVKAAESNAIKAVSKVKADVDQYLTYFQQLQTQKSNRSKTLLDLQSLNASLQIWTPQMQNAEEQLLSLIQRLRHLREEGGNAGKTEGAKL